MIFQRKVFLGFLCLFLIVQFLNILLVFDSHKHSVSSLALSNLHKTNAHVLITGAAGFIGHHLLVKLKRENVSVIGIDNFDSPWRKLKEKRAEISGDVLRVDLCDRQKIADVLKQYHITHVVNFAAQAGVTYSVKNPIPFVRNNIQCFVTLLELLKNTPISLVYASSSSVYGLNKQMPFSETHNVNNVASVYAATKLEVEMLAQTYWNMYRQKSIGLRFFTVYGPWGRPDMAYFSFTQRILARESIKIRNFGDQTRDFTYVDDIIDGVMRALRACDVLKSPMIFNLGRGEPHKVIDLVNALEHSLQKNATKVFVGQATGDVLKTFADITLAKNLLRYDPVTSLSEGIKKFVEWYLNQDDILLSQIAAEADQLHNTTAVTVAAAIEKGQNEEERITKIPNLDPNSSFASQECSVPLHTYVIGARDSQKKTFREVCRTLGTQCHFVPGFFPHANTDRELIRSLEDALSIPLNSYHSHSDLGRTFVHVDVWKHASDFGQSESREWVVILEADAILNPFVHNYYAASIKAGLKEFFCRANSQGLVYLGRCPSTGSGVENATKLPRDVCVNSSALDGFENSLSSAQCVNTLCSHAYAVRRNVAADLYVNLYFKHNVCSVHRCSVDWALVWYMQNVLKQTPMVLHSASQFDSFDGLFVQREVNSELLAESMGLVDARKGKLRLAIIANEFFAPELGRMGGFGFGASRLALLFTERPWLGVDVVFLSGEHRGSKTLKVHGVPLLQFPKTPNDTVAYHKKIKDLNIGLVLLIDCRVQYTTVLKFIDEKVPVIVWVRDPKEKKDHKRIADVRVPGSKNVPKLQAPAVTGLDKVLLSRPPGRVVLAPVSKYLKDKIADAYPEYTKGIEEGKFPQPKIFPLLPNLMDMGLPSFQTTFSFKAKQPTVAFLGRLDPIKRAWLYVELARRLPNITFLLAGESYTRNELGFSLSDLPKNVEYLKFSSGKSKNDLLRRAWLVISTSAHEGLALNFLEAFWFSAPVVATTDPEGVISRFGIYVKSDESNYNATGWHLLPALETAISTLISDTSRRHALGQAAWKWVRATHTTHRFTEELRPILRELGIATLEPVSSFSDTMASSNSAPPALSIAASSSSPSLTAVSLCYDEKRFENLKRLVQIIEEFSAIERMIIICNNPSACPSFTSRLKKIVIVHATENSINNRWNNELLNITTKHVFVFDDDLRPSNALSSALERGYQLAVRFPSQLIALGGTEMPCRRLQPYSLTPCHSADFLVPPYIVPTRYLPKHKEVSEHDKRGLCDDISMFLIATAKAPAILLQPSNVAKVFALSKTGLRSTEVGSLQSVDWRNACGKQFLGLVGSLGSLPRRIIQLLNNNLTDVVEINTNFDLKVI